MKDGEVLAGMKDDGEVLARLLLRALRIQEAPGSGKGGLSVYDVAELAQEASRFWLAMDGWATYEAAHLLFAIDPHALARWARATAWASGTRVSLVAFPVAFDHVQTMLKRAVEVGTLRFPATPPDVIAWATQKSS